MVKTLVSIYPVFFFISVFSIIIIRLILIFRLYAIKGNNLFGHSAENEIISFLASMTLPFKLTEEPKNHRANSIIRTLNKLKTAYWWLMLSLVIFIITLNVLEHGFGNKILD